MTSFTSGFVVWNYGTPSNPDFRPMEIYPPALQMAELTETVYATYAECEAAIQAGGGPHNYSAAKHALGSHVPGTAGAAAAPGQVAQALSHGWTLGASGIAGWFFRGLKIIFGGILIIIGIAKLTGADNKVVQLAGKAAPFLVAA